MSRPPQPQLEGRAEATFPVACKGELGQERLAHWFRMASAPSVPARVDATEAADFEKPGPSPSLCPQDLGSCLREMRWGGKGTAISTQWRLKRRKWVEKAVIHVV